MRILALLVALGGVSCSPSAEETRSLPVFRFAFGPCSARDSLDSAHPGVAELSGIVLRKLDELAARAYEEFLSIDNQSVEYFAIGMTQAMLAIHREQNEAGELLIVVQGFLPTWRSANWIGTNGIGHLVAEGIVMSPDGSWRPAPDEIVVVYR